MRCTFFGHRDCLYDVMIELKEVIIDLIENKKVDIFYIGNHGNFDLYVYQALKELKIFYPHIKYYVVLAYMPSENDLENTLLPEGIECVPKRYAISYRNKWMVNNCDYVVSYLTRNFGGAYKFASMARRKNKICINLCRQ